MQSYFPHSNQHELVGTTLAYLTLTIARTKVEDGEQHTGHRFFEATNAIAAQMTNTPTNVLCFLNLGTYQAQQHTV